MSFALPDYHPVKIVDLGNVQSFADIRREGFIPYTLGPLYVYGEFPHCLPAAFAKESKVGKPEETRGAVLQLGRPIISHCEYWNFFIEVMDKESFPWFKNWLQAYQFVNKRTGTYCVPRFYTAPVADPLVLDKLGKIVPESLDVISMTGLKGGVKPKGMISGVSQVGVPFGKSQGEVAELLMKKDTADLLSVSASVPFIIDLEKTKPEEAVVQAGQAALQIIRSA